MKAAVEQAPVAEPAARAGERDPHAPVAPDDQLLDRAVDGDEARSTDVPSAISVRPGGTARSGPAVRTPQGVAVEAAERREPAHVAARRGVADGRLGVACGASPRPPGRATRRAPELWRSRPRRRRRAAAGRTPSAGGARRGRRTRARQHEEAGRLGHARRRAVGAAVEQRQLPEHLAGAAAATSTRGRPAGGGRAHRPSSTSEQPVGRLALAPEQLPAGWSRGAARPRARRARRGQPLEERHPVEVRRDVDCARRRPPRRFRHRGPGSRTRARRRSAPRSAWSTPAPRATTWCRRVSGSDATSSDCGTAARVHRVGAVAADVLAAERVPEAHERQVGLEQRVVVGIPAVVEGEAGRDERSPVARKRLTGDEVSMPWRSRTSRRRRRARSRRPSSASRLP